MKQFFKLVFASMVGFILANIIMTVLSLFIVGLIIGLASSTDRQDSDISESKTKILRIDLDGPIVERIKHRDIHFSEEVPILGERSALGLYDLQMTLKKAAEDEKVKGIYINAGDVSAGQATLTALRRSLVEFKESKKFIYAYSDRYSEANYYISSVADAIFMYPQGDFEMDGYAIIPGFFKETLDKLEIQPMVYRAGAFKSAVEPFIRNDLSEENRLQLNEMLSGLWDVFINDVAASREISREELTEITSARQVSTPKQAMTHKLIDEIKYEDEVYDFLRGVVGSPQDKEVPFVSVRTYGFRKETDSPSAFIEISRSKMASKENRIAVIFAEGEIVEGRSRDDQMGSETLVEMIREARDEEKVKGLVVRINSPGGSALASDEIWRELDITNDKIPVIASMSDVAASGGYYIASGAREIYAEGNTITGSIGVFGLNLMMKDFFKNKLGVSFDRVVTHPFADIGSSLRAPTESEVEKINKEIDRVYTRFLSVIDEGREINMDELKKVAGGRVWVGNDALKRKLVDQIGGLPQALDRAAELAGLGKNYEVLELPRPESPLSFFFHMFSAKMNTFFSEEPLWLAALKKEMGVGKSLRESGIYTLMPFKFEVE